jgi:hypothetical protein
MTIEDEHFPKDIKKFKDIAKKISDKQVKSCLTRYTYRFRLAKAFEGLQAPTVSKRTLDGYSIATKLFFAYSAYDEIREVEKLLRGKSKVKTYKVFNFSVANKIRRNRGLQILLMNSVAVNEVRLKNNLKLFYENQNNEVMCIATALRHCFAHGDFTASSAELRTKSAVAAIEDLIEIIQSTSNELFSKIVSTKS